jgi:hypothetical protein
LPKSKQLFAELRGLITDEKDYIATLGGDVVVLRIIFVFIHED